MSMIIKMSNIKTESHLESSIHYIMQGYKTEGRTYSNSGVTAKEIYDMFCFTKEQYGCKGNRKGYHFYLSFSPDEKISYKKCQEFIQDFADKFLKDKYDYVCATHSDRDHTHAHLIFNSVSRSGKKFRYEKNDFEKVIKPIANELAKKYNTGSLKEKEPNQNKDWTQIITSDIDSCIKECQNYDEFKELLQSKYKYSVREGLSQVHGVYLALKPYGKSKAVRSYQLPKGYMPADIERKILDIEIQPDEIEESKEYKEIYKRYEFIIIKKPAYIPYKDLSIYQQESVKRMLEARRLYSGTNATSRMREQYQTAMQRLYKNSTLICGNNIRSNKSLRKQISLLEQEKQILIKEIEKIELENTAETSHSSYPSTQKGNRGSTLLEKESMLKKIRLILKELKIIEKDDAHKIEQEKINNKEHPPKKKENKDTYKKELQPDLSEVKTNEIQTEEEKQEGKPKTK